MCAAGRRCARTSHADGAFGGDPDNVTVLGQSAGAGSIAALLAMPTAAGVVRRAILQSIPGTYFTPDVADDVATEICAELGRSPTTGDLADVAPDDLVAMVVTVKDRLPRRVDRWGAVAHTPTPFSPVVDGDVLPAAPWAALAAGLTDIDDVDVDVLIDGLSPTPGARRYREAFPGLIGNALRETALSDWLFRMPALHLAEAADRGGARVWFYELRWGFGPQGGSHGLDTLLVFGTTDVAGEVTAAGPAALDEERQLAQLIRADHLTFAATGDPGWARFHERERLTRVYDPEPGLVPYPEDRSRTIWRDQRFGVLHMHST